MPDKENKYELIEKYLNGELTGSELASFEESLLTDPNLQEEVALHKGLHDFISNEAEMKLRSQLAVADRESRKGKVISFNMKFLAVAASIIVIFFTGYFLLNTKNNDGKKLFAQNFQAYQMVISSRGGNNGDSIESKAVNLYQQGLYDQSVSYWNALIEKDSTNMWAIFYRGICFLSLKKSTEARKDFEKVIAVGNNLFVQQAAWYEGLSYLQENNNQKACSYFSTIQSQDYKQQEIKNILDKICK